jgi:cyanophycin synthetase
MSDIWDVAPSVPPFFRYRQKWRPLAGFAFGLRETAAVGQIRLSLPAKLDFAALDRRMAKYIQENPPEHEPGAGDSPRLVRRALFFAAALQRQAHQPVFGEAYVSGPHKSERAGEAFMIAVPYYAPQAATTALHWVGTVINSFLTTGVFAATGAQAEADAQLFARAVEAIEKYRPNGVNPFRLLAAAHELDIPARQFLPEVISFGMGVRTRLMRSSFTDRTSLLSTGFTSNKMISAEVLRRRGLPAPTHQRAKSPEEAVSIAHRLGYPVVVKPADRQQGKGVSANLKGDEAVAAAYQKATRYSKMILVEKHFEGTDYRMTVLDGKIFRVSVRLPGGVVGDGKSTIAELVEIAQRSEAQQLRSRERGRGHLVDLDAEAMQLLSEAGLAPETVLAEGQYQRLRRRGNVSAGATPMNIKIEDVHPDNIRLAERAVSALWLDLGGADVILPDIKKSWLETGGLICEVNSQPQLGPRSMPPLLKALLNGDGRIPVLIVVSATMPIDWPARAARTGRGTGFASTRGIWLGQDRVAGVQQTGFAAGHILVSDSRAEMAVIVMNPSEIQSEGLPVDRCDLLILDAPDSWAAGDRAALSELLEITLPQSRKTVYTQPAHALLGQHRVAGRLEPAGSETIQQICERFLDEEASRQPAGGVPSARPLAANG